MKTPRYFISIFLFSTLWVCSLACSEGDTGNPQIKIISWRCQHKEVLIICNLSARKNSPGEFNSLFHPEFRDESGNVVNTCNKCKQTNSRIPPREDQEQGNMIMIFALASDSTLYNILATIPASPEIKTYKFQFTDETSSKIISNTVEGTVSEPN